MALVRTPMKRARVDRDTADAISKASSNDGFSISVSSTESNGAKKYKAKSWMALKQHPTKTLPYYSLVNYLFPKLHIKRWSYGQAYTAHTVASGPSLDGETNNLYTRTGESNWWEYLHLPYDTPPAACDFSLKELIQKTQDAQQYQGPLSINQTLTTAARNTNLPVSYLGGSYEHYFENVANFPCTIQLSVSRPRRILRDHPLSPYGLLPCSLSLQDKRQNEPMANFYTPLSGQVNADAAVDPQFNFSKHDRQLHYNWVVSPPKRFTLAPGESLTYIVNCPAFQFDDSAYRTTITTTGNQSTASYPGNYLPFCTQVLSIRLIGDIAHQASDAILIGQDYRVGYSASHVLHTVKSFHSLRSLPPTVQDQVVFSDGFDKMKDVLGLDVDMEQVDPDGDEQVTYDDDAVKLS